MFTEVDELNLYAVATRRTPAHSKPKPTWSPRHERRRAKPGDLCNGAHRRRNKRDGL